MSGLYLGIMSGTSLDGVDIVAAEIDERKVKLVHEAMYPFPQEIKSILLKLSQGELISLEQLGILDHQLGLLYANTVIDFLAKNHLDSSQIIAIGCHGQTVYHQPTGIHRFTMQLGDANLIAALTQITTVADFRRKDMALGGQGAPLVPAFHQYLFADPERTRIIVNIGGIANITVLQPSQSVIGYDTGPGNMLMDAWVQKHQGHPYDQNGQWAATGQIHQGLLADGLADPYFKLTYPKSTGREYFHLGWLEQKLTQFEPILPEDVQASLLALTVQSLANEMSRFAPDEVFVCGGGARNLTLMQALAQALPQAKVMTTDDFGVSSDGMEALAFAWLAHQCLMGKTANLPDVTGASRPCRLGAIYYPD